MVRSNMKTKTPKNKITAISTIFIALVAIFTTARATPAFEVDVTGSGPALILIPGLSCSGDVWNETAQRYSPDYECHQLTLAGFAGVPSYKSDHSFTDTVVAELVKYIQERQIEKPILIGHSLGGFLSLKLASENPGLVESLIIVDSLPFLPGVYNPAATVESNRGQADQIRQGMLQNTLTHESAKAMLQPMVNSPKDTETIVQWMMDSDGPAVANAMFDLNTTDLRQDIASIEAPTLVMGAWIGYRQYGATRDSVSSTFNTQYQNLPNYQLEMTDKGKHFIMLDDSNFFFGKIDSFLAKD